MVTITNDTRATQGLVGLVVLVLAIATVSGVLYVAGQERVKQEAAPDATVEQSSIEAESTSQLEIKPLVGDDISLEETKVRLTFKDRDAPQAVITDLEQAKAGSAAVTVTTTESVETAGEPEPVTKTVTSYEPTGETTSEVTLQTYKWQTERTVERHLYEYQHKQYGNVQDRELATSDADPQKESHYTENAGKVIVWEYTDCRHEGYVCGEDDRVTKTWKGAEFEPWNGRPTVTNQTLVFESVHPVEWATTTETDTVTTTAPAQPGDGWKQVSTWETTTETERISRYKCWNGWFERGDAAFDQFLDDDEELKYPEIGCEVEYETVTSTETTTSATKPGAGWERVGPVTTGEETYELDEPQPVYEERTREVVVGYDVSNTTQEVETEQTLYAAEDAVDSKAADANPEASMWTDADAADDAPADRGVDRRVDVAAANAAFLDGPGVDPAANSAVGVGGTLGTSTSGTWTQGETVVVQLDRPLLFEGDRVRVEIIDRETNSLVMDRTVRIENTERFQFTPEGGTTVASESAPASPEVDVAADAPDTSLGNLPDADNPDVDSPDTGSSAPGDTGNSTEDMVEAQVTGDNEGENTEEKVWVEPGFTRRTTHAESGTVPENGEISYGLDHRTGTGGIDADYSTDAGSSVDAVAGSGISGTPSASIPGFSRGGGGSSGGSGGASGGGSGGSSGGGSGGSSGGGSSGGAPSGNPGGGGVV